MAQESLHKNTDGGGEFRPPQSVVCHVGFLLNRAAGRIRARFTDALTPLQISPRHFGVLALLAESGPLSQQDISVRTWFGRTTMVNLVDDLEALGLARREACPDDRRAYAVCLTEKGRQIEAGAQRIAAQVNEDFLREFSPSERQQLHVLLLRLALNGESAGAEKNGSRS